MIENKFIKISLSIFVLLIVLWLAMPSAFSNKLFSYNNTLPSIKTETKLQTPELDEEYKKPVYFNIFKFVTDLIPGKH